MTEVPSCPKGMSHCIECEDFNEDMGCIYEWNLEVEERRDE